MGGRFFLYDFRWNRAFVSEKKEIVLRPFSGEKTLSPGGNRFDDGLQVRAGHRHHIGDRATEHHAHEP